MVVDLSENKRQEFLNALVTVRPPGRFKVLVVDKRSLQVLNKTLKLSEILEHDVVRIEKIENNRKDDPDVEALYILTPSKQSITRLINDFPASQQSHHHMQHPGAGGRPSGAHPGTSARKQPRYRCAHVFFTSELPNNLLKLIKSSGVTPYIKALRELCIEYDVHDSHVFLTRLFNHPLYRIYSPLISSLFNDELEMISKKLANVCGALKENPVVRYLLLDQEMHGDTKARPLAFLFHTEMDRIRDALPSDNTSKNKLQSELIIVDRSADPFAPVLHEFTYEAMVHDLLRVEDGNQVPYTVELANGTTESKMLKLDDSDQIWQEFRFHHISDAQQGIMKKFENLVGSNKAIADMQSGAKLNVSKMRDVVNKLPQFKEQVAVLSAHITIMQDCMEEFNNRCLKDLAMIEQNLAVGTTPEGEKYSAGDIDVADVLNNPDIKPKDKLRLLLIFFVANPSLTEQERQKLAHMAKLSREAREAIKNMGLVIRWSHALDLLKQLKQRPTQTTKPGKWGFGAIRGPNNKEEDENKPYDLSRYMPAFKNVLEDCITGNLSEDMFPYVVPPERPRDSNPLSGASSLRNSGSARLGTAHGQGTDRTSSPASSMWTSIANSVGINTQDSRPSSGTQDTGAGPPRQIKSLRSGRPTWQKRDSAPASAQSASTASSTAAASSLSPTASTAISPIQQNSHSHGRSRIILFVIGGITLSEVRAAEEVARKQGREIIVGSTHIADPSSYLKEISSLSFELSDTNGRLLKIKPSYSHFGYGGPPEIDPLDAYDEKIDKPQSKPSGSANASTASDVSGMSGAGGSGSSMNSYNRSSSRGSDGSAHLEHSRNQSRSSSNRHPDSATMPASYRSHGSAPPPQQQQQHQQHQQKPTVRSDAHQSSSGTNNYPRPQGSQGSMRPLASGGRSTSEGPSNNGGGVSREYGGSGAGYSSRQNSQHLRGERTASPAYHRGAEGGQYDREQDFRSGYDEYRQQQVLRSKSSHSSFGHSSRAGTPQGMPPPPQQQRQLSKEELFRAKFEQSQNEWNAQKLNIANVNPSAIPDMHKVNLNPGNSGRGRSGSNGDKTKLIRRYL